MVVVGWTVWSSDYMISISPVQDTGNIFTFPVSQKFLHNVNRNGIFGVY